MQSLIAEIEKELPLTLERETDCRETWPKRWALLKANVEKITTHNTHITQALREIAAEMEKEVSLISVPEGSEVRDYIRKWAQQLRNV